MAGFRGKYAYAIDSKGRVNLPSKLKKHVVPESDGAFVITRGLETCLFLYPIDTWNILEQDLTAKLNAYREQDRLFLRTLLMWVHEVSLDKQSRIMIPGELLEFAKISSNVVLIGALDKIELWDPEELDTYLKRYADQPYEDVAARVMGNL